MQMRKFITIAILALCSFYLVNGQDTRTVEAKPFSKLVVFGSFNVELIPGLEESIKLESSDIDLSKVTVIQEGDYLKIKAAKNLFSKERKVKVYIVYKHLSYIKANGGAFVESTKAIEKQNLKLIARNGSNFNFPVSAENLSVVVGQGATVSLEGACGNLEVKAGNGGLFNAYDLKSANTNAKAKTGAIVKISSSKNLEASVFVNGQISYRGTPKLLVNQIFGGSVEKVKE